METSSQRTYFAWGSEAIVAEYTETSTTPAYNKGYVYAGSRLLMTATKASSSTETQEFHHPDRLGTQLAFRQTTFPFGTTIGAETTGNTNQVFTSYDRSSVTGLDYAVNRTYSKGQGRFTQVDPIAMASANIGNPQSNNLYAYLQNMPTDFVDPSGLDVAFIYPTNCRVVGEARDGSAIYSCDWNIHWMTFGSGGGDYGGNGVGGGGSVGSAGGYDFKRCADLAKKIANIEKDLQKRKEELFFDIFGLPDLPPWPGAPNKLSRSGHVEIIDATRENLRKRKEEYEQNCRGGGGGGGKPSTAPTPFRVPIPGRPPRLPVPGPIAVPQLNRPVRPGIQIYVLPPLIHCLVDIRVCNGSLNGE